MKPRCGFRARQGSIPAWAGKPASHELLGFAADEVYPRVGGETAVGVTTTNLDEGLSPRGRGNQLLGEVRIARARVYPRVGGETQGELIVYPRRGNPPKPRWSPAASAGGLSPRGRGNRVVGATWHSLGEIAQVGLDGGVYPRVGGETCHELLGPHADQRPSVYPRVGGETSDWAGIGPIRSIPAWAGKPVPGSGDGSHAWVYPRVGGETSAS